MRKREAVAGILFAAVAGVLWNPNAAGKEVRLEVPPGLRIWGIWTESQTTLEVRESLLCEVEFASGTLAVSLSSGTTEGTLVERVWFGPGPVSLLASGPGRFTRRDGEEAEFDYEQVFKTDGGVLTFRGIYRPGVLETDVLTAEEIDDSGWDSLFYPWADLEEEGETTRLEFSAFSGEVWHPVAYPRPSPLFLLFEDGLCVGLEMENGWLYRGVSGETGNRRLAGARIRYGGHDFQVKEYGRAIYAARHHNWNQRFRMWFRAPLDGVHGIDVLECPEPGAICPQGFSVGETVARYLDGQGKTVGESLLARVGVPCATAVSPTLLVR